MQLLVSILVFAVLSVIALAQGTMSTDDSQVSGAEASLSGVKEDGIDARKEEVQLQEDAYDPSVDEKPVEVDTREQEEEVVSPTP